MAIEDEVREKILSEFKAHLDNHLLSHDSFPLEATIIVKYDDCRQTLTINFENATED